MRHITVELPETAEIEHFKAVSLHCKSFLVNVLSEGLTYGQVAAVLRNLAGALDGIPTEENPSAMLAAHLQELVAAGVLGIRDRANEASADEGQAAAAFRRLVKRLEAADHTTDDEALLIDLIRQGATLRQAFVDHAIERAQAAGRTIVVDRRTWLASASDEQLDREKDLCLFVSEIALPDWDQFMGFVWGCIETAVADREEEFLDRILEALPATDDFTDIRGMADDLKAQIRRYPEFEHAVLSATADKPLLVTPFLRSFDLSPYVEEEWLNELLEEGGMVKVKRGNRWVIVPK